MIIHYRSKGVSKSAFIKSIIGIVLLLVLAAILTCEASSMAKGPWSAISFGGTIKYFQEEHRKYSYDEQLAIMVVAVTLIVCAGGEAIVLALSCKSWTEISQDAVRANSMGKSISYPINNIGRVSRFGDYVIISGQGGNAVLITKDPGGTHDLLTNLILRRNAQNRRY